MKTNSWLKKEPSGRAGVDQPSRSKVPRAMLLRRFLPHSGIKVIHFLNFELIEKNFMKINSVLKKEPSGRAGVDQPS